MERMQHPEARKSLEAFLEQSLSANIPWPSELARDTAHTCQAEQCCNSSNPAGPASHDAPAGDTFTPGKLTIEESIRKDARKVKLHARKHPALLSCSNCGGTCTPRDQFSTALSAHAHAAGLPPEVPTTNEEVAALKWRGVPHGDDPVSALRRCIILVNSQSHKPSHHPTCLKSQKAKQSGLCRGKLPAVACPACAVEFILGCPDHPDAVDLEDQPKAESEDRKAFISAMIDVILETQDPAALRCTLRAPSGSPAATAGPEGTSSRAAPEAFAFCPHVAVSRVRDIVEQVLAIPDDQVANWMLLLNRMLEIDSAPRSRMCLECGKPHEVVSLSLALKRDAVSTWISQYSPAIGICFGCNNNCQELPGLLIRRHVRDQKHA